MGLGLIVLLLGIVVPYVMSLREYSRQTECADHLHLLLNALNDYAADHKSYPRVPQDPVQGNRWTAFTGADDAEPFELPPASTLPAGGPGVARPLEPAEGGAAVSADPGDGATAGDEGGGGDAAARQAATREVAMNDVTASLWLLVREGYVSDTDLFICPSTSDYRDALTDSAGRLTSPKRRGNFRSSRNLSYSMQTPFSSLEYYNWNDLLPAECALMADRGPGVAATEQPATAGELELSRGNSPNHGYAGQNVLYADTSVRFEKHPYVGIGYQRAAWRRPEVKGDNIYTALRKTPILYPEKPPADGNGAFGRNIGPAWLHDSYLVPAGD